MPEEEEIGGDPPRSISVEEFREAGFLQEVNRLFFHPRGLALSAEIDPDGTQRLGVIWDYRDDPEGIVFSEEVLATPEAREKAKRVGYELERHRRTRIGLLGSVIQEVPGE